MAAKKPELVVELSQDAYDYNSRLFTLEITLMENGQAIENEADMSQLSVKASPEEQQIYLEAARESAQEQYARTGNIRRIAGQAAQHAAQILEDRMALAKIQEAQSSATAKSRKP